MAIKYIIYSLPTSADKKNLVGYVNHAEELERILNKDPKLDVIKLVAPAPNDFAAIIIPLTDQANDRSFTASTWHLHLVLSAEELIELVNADQLELLSKILKSKSNANKVILTLYGCVEYLQRNETKMNDQLTKRLKSVDYLSVTTEQDQEMVATMANCDSTLVPTFSNLPKYPDVAQQKRGNDIIIFAESCSNSNSAFQIITSLAKLLASRQQEQIHLVVPNNLAPEIAQIYQEFTAQIVGAEEKLPIKLHLNRSLDELSSIIWQCKFAFFPYQPGFTQKNPYITAMMENNILVISHRGAETPKYIDDPHFDLYQSIILYQKSPDELEEQSAYTQFVFDGITRLLDAEQYKLQLAKQTKLFESTYSRRYLLMKYQSQIYNTNDNQYPNVNSDFWYHDAWMRKVILAQGATHGIKFSEAKYGGVLLNEDGQVYIKHGRSYSIAGEQVLGDSESGTAMKLEDLEQTLQATLKIPDITDHTIVFALNIQNLHWVLTSMNFSSKQEKIASDVTFNIYESSGLVNENTLDALAVQIKPLIKKYKIDNREIDLSVEVLYPRKQTDGSSCGPITVSSMWQLIINGCVAKSEKYTQQEILQLRSTHLVFLNDPQLTAEQLSDATPVKNQPKPKMQVNHESLLKSLRDLHINHPATKQEFYNTALCFIISEWQDEIANLGFVTGDPSIDKQMRLQRELLELQLIYLNKQFVELNNPELIISTKAMTTQQKADALIKNKAQLKKWFSDNEDKLRAHDFFEAFFKAERSQLTDDHGALCWNENGIHLFNELAIRFFQAPLELPANPACVDSRENQEIFRSTDDNDENESLLSDMEDFELLDNEVNANVNHGKFTHHNTLYNGQTDIGGLPHGVGKETYQDIGNQYMGEFEHGRRVGVGMEEQIIAHLGIRTHYNGMRTQQGNFKRGNIFCCIGGPIIGLNNPEIYAFYQGSVKNGLFHGVGTISLHSPKATYNFNIVASFNNGIILDLYKTLIPKDERIFQAIINHVSNNSTSLSLYLNKDMEDKLAKTRQEAMQQVDLKPPPKAVLFAKRDKDIEPLAVTSNEPDEAKGNHEVMPGDDKQECALTF